MGNLRLAPRNHVGYSEPYDPGERFFATGSKAGIQAQHVDRLRIILGRLNVSIAPNDMNLPGLDLHPLKSNRRGTWAVKVSGNWRITFTFVGKDADDVDYEDYH